MFCYRAPGLDDKVTTNGLNQCTLKCIYWVKSGSISHRNRVGLSKSRSLGGCFFFVPYVFNGSKRFRFGCLDECWHYKKNYLSKS